LDKTDTYPFFFQSLIADWHNHLVGKCFDVLFQVVQNRISPVSWRFRLFSLFSLSLSLVFCRGIPPSSPPQNIYKPGDTAEVIAFQRIAHYTANSTNTYQFNGTRNERY
jgi:hypothetical protein